MTGIVCAIVGNAVVSAVAEVIRYKHGVAAIGNAQVSTAQSYFGGSSYLGDGTGDRLNVPSLGRFAQSADFTVEAWVRPTNFTSNRTIFSQGSSGSNVIGVYCAGSTGTLIYYANSGSRITGSNLSANTWYHIALSRSGSDTKLFVNGTQVGSTYTDSTAVSDATFYVGSWYDGTSSWNGHIDELRYSKNARYTTTFTSSTTPFVNDANTLLLLHMDGTTTSTYFDDDNGLRAPIGLRGTGSAALSTTQSKFGGSSLRTVSANETKIAFDNAALNAIGTGDFTIEFWTRLDAVNQTTKIFVFTNEGNAGRRGIQLNNQTVLYTTDGNTRITTANVLSANTWHHIAVVRVGSTTRVYVDGTDRGNYASDTQSMAASGNSTIANLATGYAPNGYMDEFRISKVARYTSGFTPSTSAFVNDSDTTLLIHFDGTVDQTIFRDDNGARAAVPMIPTGNAEISTSAVKIGYSSMLLSGTTQYLTTAVQSWHAASAGTIECYFYFNSTAPFAQGIFSQTIQGASTGFQLLTVGNKLYWYKTAASALVYDFTLSTGTWYHVAVVKESSTTVKIYVDGTLRYTDSSSSGYTDANTALLIGRGMGISSGVWSSDRYDLNGYIDEFRISNTARYTANFTPSTTPFQNDANTLFLAHFEATAGTQFFFDDNGIVPTHQYS